MEDINDMGLTCSYASFNSDEGFGSPVAHRRTDHLSATKTQLATLEVRKLLSLSALVAALYACVHAVALRTPLSCTSRSFHVKYGQVHELLMCMGTPVLVLKH